MKGVCWWSAKHRALVLTTPNGMHVRLAPSGAARKRTTIEPMFEMVPHPAGATLRLGPLERDIEATPWEGPAPPADDFRAVSPTQIARLIFGRAKRDAGLRSRVQAVFQVISTLDALMGQIKHTLGTFDSVLEHVEQIQSKRIRTG